MENKIIRCKICNSLKEGIILNHYNLKLCFECFPSFFRKRVVDTIEKFKMFEKSTPVLVALSGGKDSMSITKALKDLGYNIRALHINIGIDGLSEKTEELVSAFCEKEGILLKILKLKDFIDFPLKKLSKVTKKPVCAVCGMLRRYLMNKEGENQTIVTGHNLNDEVSFILKNMLFWNDDLLSRISPVLKEKEGLSRKVKPLCLITEDETRLFCKISGIQVIEERCPYKSEVYNVFKGIVEELNKNFPGSIIGFYKGYLKRSKIFYRETDEQIVLNPCKKCGYLTLADLCSICRLKEKLLEYKHG